jgi:hypothetical protein
VKLEETVRQVNNVLIRIYPCANSYLFIWRYLSVTF